MLDPSQADIVAWTHDIKVAELSRIRINSGHLELKDNLPVKS
jgi:hypothetical protein